jgi:hypothetical protein
MKIFFTKIEIIDRQDVMFGSKGVDKNHLLGQELLVAIRGRCILKSTSLQAEKRN